jgi:hypothetical protein
LSKKIILRKTLLAAVGVNVFDALITAAATGDMAAWRIIAERFESRSPSQAVRSLGRYFLM